MRDQDVRFAVRTKLELDHAGDSNTRIVEEMGIWSGSVRIDVAVINGELSGFELKSARDTLARLPQQCTLYSEVFDRMTIVTAENHLKGCLSTIPEWWGVTVAYGHSNSSVGLFSFRTCEPNVDQKPLQLARLLWRQEALHVLLNHDLIKGCRSKPAEIIYQKLATELPLDVLKDEVRNCLKNRVAWLG